MDEQAGSIQHLKKGANVALASLGAESGGLTIFLDTRGHGDTSIDADVSVLLLDTSGKVGSESDFVFYNHPSALGGAVRLGDKIVADAEESGTPGRESGWSSDAVTLVLADVPEEVERIVLAASLDPGLECSFGQAAAVRLRVRRTIDAADVLVYDIDDATSELALVFGEIYRRSGEWKFRAVGQGYDGGLEALVAAYGVEVDGDSTTSGLPATEEVAPLVPSAVTMEPMRPLADHMAVDAPETPQPKRGLSVRRATRAPKLSDDWRSDSANGSPDTEWQTARLFPVAGIGNGEEQERRATSALLAVMGMVREFGTVLTVSCGAPRGSLEVFVEVPFGDDGEGYRPDGLLRVTRGQKTWTALVEVKTSTSRLDAVQIEHYVDIAKAKGFDAVITISNELTGGDAEHPVAFDRRKLRKVALHHLSWDQIRAQAVLTARHRGVADATQRKVLEEFIRYMSYPRSGMGGMGDMGASWVKLRDSVKAKTARAGDKATGEISARFDELIQHVAHHFTGLLGVEVRALTPRETPDHASRRQQLADSGLLFGRLKVPGAIDAVVVGADLRSDKVTASITVPAPRGETRALTRISWLLRQLPEDAQDAMRIEAHLSGPRAVSTAALLGKVRQDPTVLIPEEQREIRSFTVSMDAALGAKRASGAGTLIGSVKGVTTSFYAEVVQHLRPWSDKR